MPGKKVAPSSNNDDVSVDTEEEEMIERPDFNQSRDETVEYDFDCLTLENLPDIAEELFFRLRDLLVERGIQADVVREVIVSIKTNTKLKPFYEIGELLSQTSISKGGRKQFRKGITKLKKTETNELLTGNKDLISKRTQSNADSDAIKHLRAVIEQMLVINKIPAESAKQAVDDLHPDVLNETLANVNHVLTDLKEMRTRNDTDQLKNFGIAGRHRKGFCSFIVGTLKNAKMEKPRELYLRFAESDNEAFFRQLLLENWMPNHHEDVLLELFNKDKPKYVKLMMEHIGNNKNCLMKTLNHQKDEFKENDELYASLRNKINDPDTKDRHSRIKGKMLFLWCIQKEMPEMAMVVLKKGQDCLAMVLIAYRESMKQKKKLTNPKGNDALTQQIQYFSKFSLDLLKAFYADNPEHAHDLLVGKVEDLDGLTPLEIAVDADFRAFIAEAPVQKLLDKIWVKNIENHNKYKYVPMILSQACPLFAPVMFDFRIPPDGDNKKKEIVMTTRKRRIMGSYFWKVKTFMNTPLVKYTYRFISYVVYLLLFSIVMLTDFRGQMSPLEMVVNIWTVIMIIEEVKQVTVELGRYVNEWNLLDIGALAIYTVGFILRMIYHGDPTICPDCLYVARIILAFSLMVFFFRSLQFLSIYDTLGPKIYMLRALFLDLIKFMLILTVFISAYGVVSNVILYPNQPLNGKLLQDVFYDAWWSLFLQFNVEDSLGLDCNATISAEYCANTTRNDIDYELCKKNQCPANTWIVSVLLAFYALITVIMMLNVLIAMFVTTFSTVSEEQKRASKMQRYRFIREYSHHSMLPPPLCVITYPYIFPMFLYTLYTQRLKDEKESQTDTARKYFETYTLPRAFAKDLDSSVNDWEQCMMEKLSKHDKDI